MECEQIKQEKRDDEYILIISEKQNSQKSEIKDNKIRIFKGVDTKKIIDEVRTLVKKIFEQFSSIKLEYSEGLENESKLISEELVKLKLVKTSEEVKKVEGKDIKILTFKEDDEPALTATAERPKEKYQ